MICNVSRDFLISTAFKRFYNDPDFAGLIGDFREKIFLKTLVSYQDLTSFNLLR